MFNLISCERMKILTAAVHSLTAVCSRVVVEKIRVFPVKSVSAFRSTVCFNCPIQFVSVQFKGQNLKDKNLYEEVYLYCLIVHLFCSGVLFKCQY